ncbi:MAG: hypothetical protein LRS46_01645 [Desulfurococcales archaeon]|nr:hypothetical protein [Desulfurococcales archaeon]
MKEEKNSDLKEFEDIPKDVIEELKEAEREIEKELQRGMRGRKRNYPTARDLAEAVREAALRASGISPDEFPSIVLEILESKGFYTGLITEKRIWRTYETLVRRGVMPDTLGVVTY